MQIVYPNPPAMIQNKDVKIGQYFVWTYQFDAEGEEGDPDYVEGDPFAKRYLWLALDGEDLPLGPDRTAPCACVDSNPGGPSRAGKVVYVSYDDWVRVVPFSATVPSYGPYTNTDPPLPPPPPPPPPPLPGP